MKFPSKVTTYKESIISKFPLILKKIESKDYYILDLYDDLKKKMTIKEYHDALVCLFALNKIQIIGEEIRYVNRDLL